MSHLPDEEYRQLKANCLRVSQTTFCFERQLEVYKRFYRLSNFRMKSLKHFAGMPCYRYSSVFSWY